MSLNFLAYQQELIDLIKAARDERGEQVEIGPSEVGTPCERKLAYKIWNMPATNGNQGDKWRARVGTAIHKQNEETFGAHTENIECPEELGVDQRWLTERKVTVGTWHDGTRERELRGSADLYDSLPLWLPDEQCVVDWKTSTPDKIADYCRGKIPEAYRVQGHCYGLGYENEGKAVKWIALMFLPRDGELNLATTCLHVEAYDASIARGALRRLEITAAKTHAGDFENLTIAQDYCSRCPWYTYGAASKLANQGRCAGAISHRELDKSDPFGIGI